MFYEWYIDKVSLFSVKHLMESRLVKQPLIQNNLKILLATWNLSEETVITFEIFQCFYPHVKDGRCYRPRRTTPSSISIVLQTILSLIQ